MPFSETLKRACHGEGYVAAQKARVLVDGANVALVLLRVEDRHRLHIRAQAGYDIGTIMDVVGDDSRIRAHIEPLSRLTVALDAALGAGATISSVIETDHYRLRPASAERSFKLPGHVYRLRPSRRLHRLIERVERIAGEEAGHIDAHEDFADLLAEEAVETASRARLRLLIETRPDLSVEQLCVAAEIPVGQGRL